MDFDTYPNIKLSNGEIQKLPVLEWTGLLVEELGKKRNQKRRGTALNTRPKKFEDEESSKLWLMIQLPCPGSWAAGIDSNFDRKVEKKDKKKRTVNLITVPQHRRTKRYSGPNMDTLPQKVKLIKSLCVWLGFLTNEVKIKR